MIERIRLNHGLHHLLTPIFYPSFTSMVMRIYNLDYVHSVRNFFAVVHQYFFANGFIYKKSFGFIGKLVF